MASFHTPLAGFHTPLAGFHAPLAGFHAPRRVLPLSCAAALLVLLAAFAAQASRAAEHDIYPPPERAAADLEAALTLAGRTHRRVLLDFGGNWCPDCRVLDSFFHDDANQQTLESNYVLVHINVGRLNENLDVAARCQIPLRRGVPALAVLGEHGELLYSQKGGEFEAMRRMQSSAVTEFLKTWQPPPQPGALR
jgi:thiol:disulfide interchange protein